MRRDRYVRTPIHLAEKVQEALIAIGLTPTVTLESRGTTISLAEAEAKVRSGELRQGYWDDWYRPFQRNGVLWAVRRGSGHLWHSPGAGKTASAIAWALAAPGTVVAVTRAGIRLHWGREVQKVSEIVPWSVTPQPERGRAGSPPRRIFNAAVTRADAPSSS